MESNKGTHNETQHVQDTYTNKEMFSYLGTTTVQMDEVCASKRQIIHMTTKKKKIKRIIL